MEELLSGREALIEELLFHWELWRTAGSICTSCSVCFVGMTEVSENCFATAQPPFAGQGGAGTVCGLEKVYTNSKGLYRFTHLLQLQHGGCFIEGGGVSHT